MDVESETAGLQSDDNYGTSRLWSNRSRDPIGRKRRKRRKENISAAEIIRRQEAACQIHNENERIR